MKLGKWDQAQVWKQRVNVNSILVWTITLTPPALNSTTENISNNSMPNDCAVESRSCPNKHLWHAAAVSRLESKRSWVRSLAPHVRKPSLPLFFGRWFISYLPTGVRVDKPATPLPPPPLFCKSLDHCKQVSESLWFTCFTQWQHNHSENRKLLCLLSSELFTIYSFYWHLHCLLALQITN